MTEQEKIQAFTLRMRGATYSEIGEVMHYDGGSVFNALKRVVSGKRLSKCIHPHVRMWMLRNGITYEMIAKHAWLCEETVARSLRSKKMSSTVILAVSEMSGLTYEQVRYVESEEQHD